MSKGQSACRRCRYHFDAADWSPCVKHGLCEDCHTRAEWGEHDEPEA